MDEKNRDLVDALNTVYLLRDKWFNDMDDDEFARMFNTRLRNMMRGVRRCEERIKKSEIDKWS